MEQWIAGIIGLVVGLIPKIWDWVTIGRRASFIDDARDLVSMMRDQLAAMQAEVAALRSEVLRLQNLVGALELELITLGTEPQRIKAIKDSIK